MQEKKKTIAKMPNQTHPYNNNRFAVTAVWLDEIQNCNSFN